MQQTEQYYALYVEREEGEIEIAPLHLACLFTMVTARKRESCTVQDVENPSPAPTYL